MAQEVRRYWCGVGERGITVGVRKMKGIHADREQMTSPLGRGVVGGRGKEEASGERLDFFTTFFWMPSGRSFCIQGDWVARAGHVKL